MEVKKEVPRASMSVWCSARGGTLKDSSISTLTSIVSGVARLLRSMMSDRGPGEALVAADGLVVDLKPIDCGQDPEQSKLQVHSGGMGTVWSQIFG